MADSEMDQGRDASERRRGTSDASETKTGTKRSFSASDAESYLATLAKFGGIVVVSIVVLAILRLTLRRRPRDDPKSSLFELLEKSRKLQEEGNLEPSEFQAIRNSVAENSQRIDWESGEGADGNNGAGRT